MKNIDNNNIKNPIIKALILIYLSPLLLLMPILLVYLIPVLILGVIDKAIHNFEEEE